MSRVGKLICVEGPEGAGKTTLFRNLQGALGTEKFLFCREPGGTPFGEDLRSVIFSHADIVPGAQFLLFMASRLHIFDTVIRPALLNGIHVVTDRMDASTYAYQVFGNNPELETVFNLLRRFYLAPIEESDWLKPLYLFLDLPPEEGFARIESSGREKNSFDMKSQEFHRRVYEGYKFFIPTMNHVTVDARQSEQDVLAIALGIIREHVGE